MKHLCIEDVDQNQIKIKRKTKLMDSVCKENKRHINSSNIVVYTFYFLFYIHILLLRSRCYYNLLFNMLLYNILKISTGLYSKQNIY